MVEHMPCSCSILRASSLAPIFLLVLIFFSPMASSYSSRRSLDHILPLNKNNNRNNKKTSTLDVAASLQQAQAQALSSISNIDNAETMMMMMEQTSSQHQSLTSISIPLHPRRRVVAPHHQYTDFAALTRSRLARDSARVISIETRILETNNSVNNNDDEAESEKNKKKKSSDNNSSVDVVEGPVVSGVSQGSGEYFSRVGIGRPATELYVVIDTGSDVSWVQCSPCAACYNQSDPVFDSGKSSSYFPLPCFSDQCRALDVSECGPGPGSTAESVGGRCLYEVSYGDGSYTIGDFATETVSLGVESGGFFEGIAIGCGHNNQGLFVGAAGLLGLGGGSLSFPAQINATSFSYCLVDRDSDAESTLDFHLGTGYQSTPTATAPLLKNLQLETFYYVDMTGLSVGGTLLPVPPARFRMDSSGNGGVIIDSGTAVTRLSAEAYSALRREFVSGTGHLPPAEGGGGGTATAVAGLFDTCYDLRGLDGVDVPAVSLHFAGGGEVELPAKNYLIPVDGEGTFCLAFAPTSSSLSIIGNVQQQGIRVTFDLANSMVGFEPAKC